MRGHSDDNSSWTPFFDQRCDRLVIHSVYAIRNCAQRTCGSCDVLTNGNTNAAQSKIEREDCPGL